MAADIHPAVRQLTNTFGVIGPGLLKVIGARPDVLGFFRLLDRVAAPADFPLTRNDFFRGWVSCGNEATLQAEIRDIRALFAGLPAKGDLVAECGFTAEFLDQISRRTLLDICEIHLAAAEAAIDTMTEMVKLTGPRDTYRIGIGPTSIVANARMSRLPRDAFFQKGAPLWLSV